MALCPGCGLENTDGSNFCAHCGGALNMQGQTQQVAATNAPVAPAPPPRPAVAPVDTADEKILWTAYPSFRTAIPVMSLYIVVYIIIAILLHLVLEPQAEQAFHRVEKWAFAAFAVILVGMLVRYVIIFRSTRYKLTSQRLFIETGLLNKRIDELELEKYRDIFVDQDLLDRIVGCGDIRIVTGDVTNATVNIKDVPDPVGKKELIRSAARERQKSIGIVRREDL